MRSQAPGPAQAGPGAGQAGTGSGPGRAEPGPPGRPRRGRHRAGRPGGRPRTDRPRGQHRAGRLGGRPRTDRPRGQHRARWVRAGRSVLPEPVPLSAGCGWPGGWCSAARARPQRARPGRRGAPAAWGQEQEREEDPEGRLERRPGRPRPSCGPAACGWEVPARGQPPPERAAAPARELMLPGRRPWTAVAVERPWAQRQPGLPQPSLCASRVPSPWQEPSQPRHQAPREPRQPPQEPRQQAPWQPRQGAAGLVPWYGSWQPLAEPRPPVPRSNPRRSPPRRVGSPACACALGSPASTSPAVEGPPRQPHTPPQNLQGRGTDRPPPHRAGFARGGANPQTIPGARSGGIPSGPAAQEDRSAGHGSSCARLRRLPGDRLDGLHPPTTERRRQSPRAKAPRIGTQMSFVDDKGP